MTILDTIIAHKKEELRHRKKEMPPAALLSMMYYSSETISLRKSLIGRKPFGIIAEIKRSSPSAGSINAVPCPATVAQSYGQNGAAGISVLTDQRFFGGTINDLAEVRKATTLPILRKEFIIDEYQVLEAKAYGADAVLLIAGILERPQLIDLQTLAHEQGLETLVEIHDAADLEKIDCLSMDLIGINNRNLHTMTTDIEQTFRLARQLPANAVVVSESGINTAGQIRLLLEKNITCGLIGEYFMKSPDPGLALRNLLKEIAE